MKRQKPHSKHYWPETHRRRNDNIIVYRYAIKYDSVIKNNEILPFAATWMDLEIITLSEVSQTEKDKPYDVTYM